MPMPTATTDLIEYPTSDGKPMAETDIHRDLMLRLIEILKGRYADRDDIYVSGNLLVFYEEGNPRRHLAPDCFVVWGAHKHRRLNYKIWEEGAAPGFVIELTSSSTRNEDRREKFELYRDTWKVKEYFLFDPYEEYLEPSMQGYRLIDDHYVRIEPTATGDLHSETTGLHLRRQGIFLTLVDDVTGKEVLPPDAIRCLSLEQELQGEKAARERMEAAARAEREAREQAEAEVAKLRSELETLRRQVPPGV